MRRDTFRTLSLLAVLAASACTSNKGARVEAVPGPAPQALGGYALRQQARTAAALQSRWAALPENEKVRVQAAASKFAALPADKQQTFRAEFEALDDVTRQGYWLGPSLGEAWPHLQPAFGYVPESERPAVLKLLRGLDREHLFALERVAWRTPVEARAALREKLLGMSPAQRDAWLFEQNF